MNDKPIIVAQIIGKWVGGGVEAVVMNYYRHIDHAKIQFDFICGNDSTSIPYEEIKKLGGRVILVPPYQKIFKYQKALKKLFKENKYQVVHSHINTLSVFPLRIAKKCKIPVRIAHSHSASNKKEFKKNFLKNILKLFSKKYATVYFACSKNAGEFQFGKKANSCGGVRIIKNAIDYYQYSYDIDTRIRIRKQLKVADSTVLVGHVSRFTNEKNIPFLIDVFNEYHKTNIDSKLLLIGDGPKKEEILKKISFYKLEKSVIFTGKVKNTSDYYQAMDTFLLPSLYEGLGLVLIEAQCSGLSCIASENVPKASNICKRVNYISLKKNASYWAKMIKISDNRDGVKELFDKSGYNIELEAQKLEKFYIKCSKGGKNK